MEKNTMDAERFVVMIKRDTFDYTEWRRNLWKDKTIDEIHAMAAEHAHTLPPLPSSVIVD